MRLFRRGGADSVRTKGAAASARLTGIEVGKTGDEHSTQATYAYVVELGPEYGNRRVFVAQHLNPLEYVRLGMPLAVWVHDDDVLIDCERTMAPLGVTGQLHTNGWKCGKDRGLNGIIDDYIGIERNRKKGAAATATITAATWKSAAFGLATQLTLDSVIDLPGQGQYAVEIKKVEVPHYATHLLAVGATLPVVVRDGRPDKVAIDWPAAAMANPGVGMPPSELLAPRAGLGGGIMAGGWAGNGAGDDDDDDNGDDGFAAAVAGASAAFGIPTGSAGNTEPAPINGVSFDLYLAIEVAIRRQNAKPRDWDSIAQAHGVPAGQWAKTSQQWGMQMMRNPALAQRYAAALQ